MEEPAMASPMPTAPIGSSPWNGQLAQYQQPPQQQRNQQMQHRMTPHQVEVDESGLEVRPMGLKVQYTFDKDNKVNCLARHSQTLRIQTVSLDDTSSIGIVDLRSCVHAIMECSPELASQDTDYTIYAVDFSEPDTPLVGQGMLSWALDSMRNNSVVQQPKMVTGRVTRNLLGVFGGGNRETLEVRLRLSQTARPSRHARHDSSDIQQSRLIESAMTPTGTSEWNSFLQSNPHIGQSQPPMGNVSRVASPALSQGRGHRPSTTSRRNSLTALHHHQQIASAHEVQRIAPMPVDPSELRTDGTTAVAPSSRPSSRASHRAPRRKPPTGRPRGRPRKKPVEGNTSGYEDGTEGEDIGPAKKRFKTTVVERASPNPFASGSESLRVAASTSGSLRNFRPIANTDTASGNNSHLQDIPRAPTPVPDGPMRTHQGRGPSSTAVLRRGSTLGQRPHTNNSFIEARSPLSPSQDDGRSPDSIAPTPTYSEESPANIGSSPPVQRTTHSIRSSPPPSSPVLPPMPSNELVRDSSFATDDLDDFFGDDLAQVAAKTIPPPAPLIRRPTEARNSSGIPVQVYQMQDGPSGQDLVHICSYNTPQPSSAPGSTPSDSQSLPPLRKPPIRHVGKTKTKPFAPPIMAATPPPTTDALEMARSREQTPRADWRGEKEDAIDTAAVSGSFIAPKTTIETSPPTVIEKNEEELTKQGFELPPAPLAVLKAPRKLARSQSAGPLVLPAILSSEPIGPSSLSQSMTVKSSYRASAAQSGMKRATSSGPMSLPIPASDPVVQTVSTSDAVLQDSLGSRGDAIPPPSSPPIAARSNKNFVKKHAIRQRLEEAIMNGEMPPYCSNCGAIETPTWRKIWVQEKEGMPEDCEYSVEPGKVTTIEILRRDAENKPLLHRVIKKSLGSDDDKSKWQELLLCNPCGIWLTKCKSHRPQDRWDKDASRLGQERRKRGSGRSTSRPKRPRGKSEGVINPTSEAYLPTDALCPTEPSSPKPREAAGGVVESQQEASASLDVQETRSNPASTHSRASHGSGTVESPIEVEFDEAVGSTKRLLFPSPRKEGVLKTLGELNVNIVHTPDECRPKEISDGKENLATASIDDQSSRYDDLEALFNSPTTMVRPSTPPPKPGTVAGKGPFKTPTRSTPSHRPITRSISRSIRSIRSIRSTTSPGHKIMLQYTPTKTPRVVAFGLSGSAGRRRSPRNHQGGFDVFDTPISRTINQMFSDGTGFSDNDFDLSHLPALEPSEGGLIDFGNLLSTDAIVMPSSPPKDGTMSFDYHATASVWASWDLDNNDIDKS